MPPPIDCAGALLSLEQCGLSMCALFPSLCPLSLFSMPHFSMPSLLLPRYLCPPFAALIFYLYSSCTLLLPPPNFPLLPSFSLRSSSTRYLERHRQHRPRCYLSCIAISPHPFHHPIPLHHSHPKPTWPTSCHHFTGVLRPSGIHLTSI